jgi:hypothetical protein
MYQIDMLVDLGFSRRAASALLKSDKKDILAELAGLESREKEKMENNKRKIEKLRGYSIRFKALEF